MRLLKALFLIGSLLCLFDLSSAQDCCEQDTLFFEVENLVIPKDGGDIEINVIVWSDGVLGGSGVCYIDGYIVPLIWNGYAILDSAKNTPELVFAGTEFENWFGKVVEIDSVNNKLLLLVGDLAGWDTIVGYHRLATLTFTLEDTTTITLDSTTYWYGQSHLSLQFVTKGAMSHVPIFKSDTFKVLFSHYDFELSAGEDVITPEVGVDVQAKIAISNTGYKADTYNITVWDMFRWPITPSAASVPIDSACDSTIFFTVSIPPEVEQFTCDSLTFRVVSQGDPQLVDVTGLWVKVGPPKDPMDWGEADTIYFEASGLHSVDGSILYVPQEFPGDVEVDVWLKTDVEVCAISLPLADTCYDPLAMPTYLDPLKNDPDSVEPNCFTGTAIEDWSITDLNLYGIDPTPTPPNFLIGAVCFTCCLYGDDNAFIPYKLAHLTFTVQNEGYLCLDTISVFQPGGATPGLSPSAAITYIPIFKLKSFQVKKGLPQRGDVNADGIISLGDPIYLATYYLKGGPAPYYPGTGDVDCSGLTNLEDVIYLAKYLLKGGPPPCPMEE